MRKHTHTHTHSTHTRRSKHHSSLYLYIFMYQPTFLQRTAKFSKSNICTLISYLKIIKSKTISSDCYYSFFNYEII